jgi:hypothetical protein
MCQEDKICEMYSITESGTNGICNLYDRGACT